MWCDICSVASLSAVEKMGYFAKSLDPYDGTSELFAIRMCMHPMMPCNDCKLRSAPVLQHLGIVLTSSLSSSGENNSWPLLPFL